MSSPGVPVKLQPRAAPCHAVTTWHSESALLACSFVYGVESGRASASVAGRIDAAFGISPAARRALLGAVEITWRDDSRLHSIELRTGQRHWEPSSLPIPAPHAEQGSMTFAMEYDVNHIASLDVETLVLWDAGQARLGLRFSNDDPGRGRWATIADTVFVCIDDAQRLIELRFSDVKIVSEDAS